MQSLSRARARGKEGGRRETGEWARRTRVLQLIAGIKSGLCISSCISRAAATGHSD